MAILTARIRETHSCLPVIGVDYFVVLLSDLPKETGRQHQLIQNTAVSSNENQDLFTSSYLYKMDFKVLLLVYKLLSNLRTKYMSDLLEIFKEQSGEAAFS